MVKRIIYFSDNVVLVLHVGGEILLQPDKANEHKTAALSKVPEVTLLFWIIEIAATEEDVPA